MAAEILAEVRRISDDVLFPAAMQTDLADALPVSQLDALAAAGLYGVFGPVEAGGLSLDFPTVCAAVEELAGGCLATTFIWIQHFGLLGSLLAGDASAPLREAWLERVCRGEPRRCARRGWSASAVASFAAESRSPGGCLDRPGCARRPSPTAGC